jgi:hypothetical protein
MTERVVEKGTVDMTRIHDTAANLTGSGGMVAYDIDVLSWSEQQAALLRRVAAGETINDQIDWENVAEEIESVGQSERRSLASHVRLVLEHLAKLEASPAANPRAGWQDTVSRARVDIEDLLQASPSLRPKLEAMVAEQLPRALKLAASSLAHHDETARMPLDKLRYSLDQVVNDWFPQP